MTKWSNLIGTTEYTHRIGIFGNVLSSESRRLVTRQDDWQLAPILTSRLDVSGNQILLNSENSAFYSIQRPSNTTPVFLTLPRTLGLANNTQFLTVDGNGELSFVTSNSEKIKTATVNFNSSSSITFFQLPNNAVLTKVQVIIDTPFNTLATLAVGVASNNSRYLSSGDSLLIGLAQTVFEIDTGNIATSNAVENLIITYTRNAASVGSARVLGYYVNP